MPRKKKLNGIDVIEMPRPTKSRRRLADTFTDLSEITAADIGVMMGKELKKVERLEKELKRTSRRLQRAKMRYSVLKRLNDTLAQRSA